MSFSAFSQFTDSVLLHIRLNPRRRDIPVSRNSLTCYTGRHLRIRRLILFIFAGAVYDNALTNCAALLCRALRRVNRLCSRTVSDPANRLLKRTDSEGSSSVAEKKSSAVPLFRSGHMLAICAGLSSKGKAGVQRGRTTADCPSFLPTAVGTTSPPRRAPRHSRRPQTANPPLRFSEKLSAR